MSLVIIHNASCSFHNSIYISCNWNLRTKLKCIISTQLHAVLDVVSEALDQQGKTVSQSMLKTFLFRHALFGDSLPDEFFDELFFL